MSDRMVEYGGMPGAAALASLARWSGQPLDVVREYARRDRLADVIVEVRSSRGLETRRLRGIDRGDGPRVLVPPPTAERFI